MSQQAPWTAAIALLLVSLGQPSPTDVQHDRPVPFRVGEVLTYDVGWSTYLTAGTATLSVKDRRPAGPGVAVYDLVAEGSPTSLLDKLYHVYYKAETLLNTATLQPALATLYSDERGRTRLKSLRFLSPTRTEFQPRAGAAKEQHAVPAGTLDPLAAVYVIRQMPLKTGQLVTMSIIEDTLVYTVRWQIAAPESLTTDLGTFSAWRLTPMVTDNRGKPVANRQIVVWLSDDARRLPVKFQAALAVGSFTLTLTHAAG